MTRQVLWSPGARADLVNIGRAIAVDNPGAARSVMSKLRAAGEALGLVPTGRPGRVSGTYEKVLPRLPYIIAYELIANETSEVVAILHVIHTRRHWPTGEWPVQ